jgi:hypothetical protein
MTDVKTVRFEEGTFRLSLCRYEGGFDWWYIEHRCGGRWEGFCWIPSLSHYPCWDCHEVAPESIQVLFLFVKEET